MSTARPTSLMSALCTHLEAVMHGAAAEALLNQPATDAGHIVLLPVWAWLTPLINVGKKGLGPDNRPAVLPVRIEWPTGAVLRMAQPAETPWRLIGLGHDDRGVSRVSVRDDIAVLSHPHPPGISVIRVESCVTAGQQARVLARLAKTGSDARWLLLAELEQMVRASLTHANRAVAAEIGQYRGKRIPSVLDELSLDDLATNLLHGTGDSSVMSRMIERALRPEQFAKVDPLRYFTVGIHARAEEAVRARIGDPKVGPKVRRVFARADVSTMDELIAAYRTLYPRDSLGPARALAALTAGPEVTAGDQRELNDTGSSLS